MRRSKRSKRHGKVPFAKLAISYLWLISYVNPFSVMFRCETNHAYLEIISGVRLETRSRMQEFHPVDCYKYRIERYWRTIILEWFFETATCHQEDTSEMELLTPQ